MYETPSHPVGVIIGMRLVPGWADMGWAAIHSITDNADVQRCQVRTHLGGPVSHCCGSAVNHILHHVTVTPATVIAQIFKYWPRFPSSPLPYYFKGTYLLPG